MTDASWGGELNQASLRYGQMLRQVRDDRNVTQAALGESLEMMQSDVSRLERQRDLKVSTLASYLWALGAAEVSVQVRFPGAAPFAMPLDPLPPGP